MKALATVRKWDSQPRLHKFVVIYRQGGKRQVRYFKSEKLAKAFAQEKQIELLNEGRRNGEITSEEHRAMMVAREKGFSLKDAVEHYASHLGALNQSVTVEVAIDELLSVRQAEGKSSGHVHDLLYRLKRFARDHGDRLVASISTRDMDGWLASLACAPQTRVNYRRVIHNFFSFCAARGYAPSNPVTQASKVKVPPKEIGILSPGEAQALLQACPREILPAVAIGMFAGLRASEIARLDWRAIDLERRFIEVAAAKSKTAQRRLVPVSDNLQAWLAPYRQITGPLRLPESAYRRRFSKALKASKIENWPNNALRHSFASYRLADTQNAGQTALELGHTESRTLFAHYRELVKPEDAKRYWNIFAP